MGFKAIAPADNWFLVTYPVPPMNELIVWRVPVWALTENGDVIGLISVAGGGVNDSIMGSTCRLVDPAPIRSVYKHESELTEDEKTAVATGKPVKIES